MPASMAVGGAVVGQDLHLDVPGFDDGLLQEDRRIAEGRFGLPHGGGQRLPQSVGGVDPAHPAAAAAGDGLDEQRVADRLGGGGDHLDVGGRFARFQHRHPRRPGCGDGGCLVAGHFQHGRRRPDEGDSGVHAGLGQVRVLGQEAVAGVDGVGPGRQRGLDDLLDVQVGPDRVAALPDLVGLAGLLPVHGVAVLVREDRDRGDSEFVGRPERTDRDLAAVGHQNLREHRTTFRFAQVRVPDSTPSSDCRRRPLLPEMDAAGDGIDPALTTSIRL